LNPDFVNVEPFRAFAALTAQDGELLELNQPLLRRNPFSMFAAD
jgi:hypothetical protein